VPETVRQTKIPAYRWSLTGAAQGGSSPRGLVGAEAPVAGVRAATVGADVTASGCLTLSGPDTEESMSQSTLSGEGKTLLSCLNAQRAHVMGILEGLDEEALRRPVLPSGWNCLGLVRHLALDVERFWFRAVVAGEKSVVGDLDQDPDDAWQVGPEVPSDDVFNLYRQEVDFANTIITTTALDAEPAWWPVELFGDWRLNDLREVILHVITETACHAGHLDAARELLDGRRWLVLTD
jgi:hypothetical protein